MRWGRREGVSHARTFFCRNINTTWVYDFICLNFPLTTEFLFWDFSEAMFISASLLLCSWSLCNTPVCSTWIVQCTFCFVLILICFRLQIDELGRLICNIVTIVPEGGAMFFLFMMWAQFMYQSQLRNCCRVNNEILILVVYLSFVRWDYYSTMVFNACLKGNLHICDT